MGIKSSVTCRDIVELRWSKCSIFRYVLIERPPIGFEKSDVHQQIFYKARLIRQVNHLYILERIMVPKQILVEYLLKYFSMKMCVHLKVPVAAHTFAI